jgi:hypothetical protein
MATDPEWEEEKAGFLKKKPDANRAFSHLLCTLRPTSPFDPTEFCTHSFLLLRASYCRVPIAIVKLK